MKIWLVYYKIITITIIIIDYLRYDKKTGSLQNNNNNIDNSLIEMWQKDCFITNNNNSICDETLSLFCY